MSSSRSHCSAAASARAATERPEPAGPVNSQACVIDPGATGRSCDQVGRGPGGRLQHRDRLVLPDQGVPPAHWLAAACGRVRRGLERPVDAGGVAAAGCRGVSSVSTAPSTAAAISSTGGGRRARGSARARPRRASGTPRGPARGTPATRARACRRHLRPRARASPSAAGRSSSTVRSGRRSSVAQRDTRRTSSIDSSRPDALVGQRRVDVAVGEHDLPGVERRADHGVDVVGPVGGEQQRLGARRRAVRRRAARSSRMR